MSMWKALGVLSAVTLAGCAVEPVNPFDPASSNPARGVLAGLLVSEAGDPLSGAFVRVTTEASEPVPVAVAPDGRFQVEVAPGVWQVEAGADAHFPAQVAGLRVSSGARIDIGVMRLTVVRGAVEGRLRLVDGSSPAGATVTLVPTDGTRQAFTTTAGPSGEYRVDGVPEGEYVVRAAHLEYAPGYTESEQVDGDGRTTFPELTLQPASAVVRVEVDGQIGARFSRSPEVRALLLAFGDHVREMMVSEDASFEDETKGDVDWRQYAASVDVSLSPDDGAKTLHARFRDRWGIESPIFSTTITLDRTAPVVTAVQLGDGTGWVRALAAQTPLTIEATDALSGIAAFVVSTDGTLDTEAFETRDAAAGVTSIATSANLGTSPGPVTVLVQVRDAAGNVSEVSTVEVVVDPNPPVTGSPAILVGESSVVHARDIEVSFDVTGDSPEEPLFYVLGNASGLPASSGFHPLLGTPVPWTLAEGADGLRTLCARFQDAAGNTTDETCRDLTLDRTGRVVGSVALEEAGATLGGVTVTVTNDAQPGFLAVGTSSDDGRYEVTGLPEGASFVVRLSLAGYEGQTIRPVPVHAGLATDLEQLTLRRARGAVSGTVTLNDRPGDSGGIVISALNTPYAVTTTPTGAFLLRDLPVGTYEIAARAQGYLAGSFGAVTVVAGQEQALGALQLRRQSGSFAICRAGDTSCAQGPQAFTGARDVLLNLTSTTATQYRAGTSEDLSSVPFEPLVSGVTTYPFELDDADGEQTVYVQYGTADVPEQAVLASSVTLDRVPPSGVTVTIDPDAQGQGAVWTRHPTGQVRLAVSAIDESSGVATVRISNDATIDEAPVPLTALVDHQLDAAQDGEKTVRVVVCDRVGNCTTTPATATIRLDRVAPSATHGYAMQLAGGAATTSSGQVSVDISLGADAAAVRFGTTPTLAGATWLAVDPSISSELSFSLLLPLGDGLKTVYAQFADAAGNLSGLDPAAFSDTITLDRTPPSGSVSISAGERTNSRSVTLNLTRDADVTGVAFGNGVLDCASATYETWPASNTKAWTLPSGDGTKVVVACFRDAAGNASIASATTLLDTSPPIATATPAVRINGGATHATSVDVSLTFHVSGADTMRVSCDDVLDAEPPQPFVTQLSCNLNPTQGDRKVTATFADLAGNVLGPITATIKLDTLLPPVPVPLSVASPTKLASPSLGWTSGGGDSANFRVQVSSSATFAALAHDGTKASSPLSWAAPEGTWYWRVAALDAAGNQSAWSATQTFRVDRTPPATPLLSAVASTGSSLTLTWRAPGDDGNDGHLAGGSYDLRWLTGNSAFDFGSATKAVGEPTPGPRGTDETFVLTGLSPKTTYQLALQVCDAANNCSVVSPTVTTSTSDDTPPAAVSNLTGVVGDHSVTLTWTRHGDDGMAGGPVADSWLLYRAGPLVSEADLLLAERIKLVPGNPGTLAQQTVGGLLENTQYSFAVRSYDQAGNDSGPSNVVVLQTSRIDEVRPAAARPGDWIELHGLNFGATQALVSFSGVPSSDVGYWSNTLVRVRVPSQASSGEVRILRGALESAGHHFSVAPVLSSVYPRELVAGQSLFLTGRAFGEPGSDDTGVAFGSSFLGAKSVPDWQDGGTAPVVPASVPPGVQQVRVRQAGAESRAESVRVWSEPKTISGDKSVVLATAVSPVDGSVHALYRREINDTDTYVYARRLDGQSSNWDAEYLMTSATKSAAQPAQGDLDVDALGTAHACFIVQRYSGPPSTYRSTTLYYARRPPGGVWSGFITLRSLSHEASTYPPIENCRVAASASSGYQTGVLVLWTEGYWSSTSQYSRLQARGSVDGGSSFAAQSTICPDGSCVAPYFEGLADVSSVNSQFYRGWHLVYGRKSGVGGAIELKVAWSQVGSAASPFNFGPGRLVKSGVTQSVQPALTRVDTMYGWYPQSATYLAWNDSGTFGQTVWVTRVGDSALNANLNPSGFVKVDETASTTGARPSLSATRDGDLSVIVAGSEQASGGTGRVLRHHILRWKDGDLLERESGHEIAGVAANGMVSAAAGAQGRVALVWPVNGVGLRAAWTRLPHREPAPVQILAAPASGRNVSPLSTVTPDGNIFTTYWAESEGSPYTASLRVVRETDSGVVTQRATALGSGTSGEACYYTPEICRRATALASLPDGRAAALFVPPSDGSRTLSLCVDLMACTPQLVATGAFETVAMTGDPTGALHLVYSRPAAGVYYRHWADGKLSAEVRVDTLPGGQLEPGVSSQPVVVAGPSGTAFVVYRRVYGLNSLRLRSITRSESAPDGFVRGETIELLASASPLESPSAAWTDQGIALLWRAGGRFVMRGRWMDSWLDGPVEVSANENLRINTVLADAAGQSFVYLDTREAESYDFHLEGIDLDRRMTQPLTVGAFANLTRGDNAVAVDPRGRLVIHGHCDQGSCGGRLMRATFRANE